jgi:hypothetical protein
MRRALRASKLLGLAAVLLAVGGGCRCSRTPLPAAAEAPPPSVRLYLISTLAGALEPCGCVKDMLGGVDHFAALVAKEAPQAPRRLVLGAGPMLFMDPELEPKKREQDVAKSRVLADVLAGAQLAGWAPGANDWAGGADLLSELTGDRMTLFAANATAPKLQATRVYDLGGERVGVTGAIKPAFPKATPEGLLPGDPKPALESAKQKLTADGARVLVALLSVPRGEALRLAEAVPGYHLFVLGKPVDRGESNDPPTPPVLVGDTLVVEGPNHLQSVAVVDLHVRDGRYRFIDGSGIGDEERKLSLTRRIADLRAAVARTGISEADRAARKKDLQKLETDLAALSQPRAQPTESSFSYRLVDVREKLGVEPQAEARLKAYYQGVNEHNRRAFANVRPPPVPEGQSGYVGVEACTPCHQAERAFWDKTGHHDAYSTLTRQSKEFNLECVSCHVTGYDAPGGSTVTHVDGLTNVQCETCHGPGSRHVANPTEKTLVSLPKRTLCAEQCHHPPHVASTWSVDDAWKRILGPGHGYGN